MPVFLILDIAVFALLVFFAVRGHRKGFFMAIASVLIIVIAIFGARTAAQNLSPHVANIIEPAISSLLHSDGGERNNQPSGSGRETNFTAISFLGVSAPRAADFSNAAIDVFGGAKDVILTTAASVFAMAIAWLLVGILSFFLIILLLQLIKKAVNLVFRIPGLNFLNRFAGLLVGLATGLLVCFVVSAVLLIFDVAIPYSEIQKTILFSILCDYNFIVL